MGGSCPAGWAAGPWGLLLSGAGEGGPLVSVGFGCVKVALREGRFGAGALGKRRPLWLHPDPTARQVLGDPRCPQGGTFESPRCRGLRAPWGQTLLVSWGLGVPPSCPKSSSAGSVPGATAGAGRAPRLGGCRLPLGFRKGKKKIIISAQWLLFRIK